MAITAGCQTANLCAPWQCAPISSLRVLPQDHARDDPPAKYNQHFATIRGAGTRGVGALGCTVQTGIQPTSSCAEPNVFHHTGGCVHTPKSYTITYHKHRYVFRCSSNPVRSAVVEGPRTGTRCELRRRQRAPPTSQALKHETINETMNLVSKHGD